MKIDANDPRVTAFALGELDEEQREILERQIAECSESQQWVAEIRALGQRLSEALQAQAELAEPALTDAQRQALEQELQRASEIDQEEDDEWSVPALPRPTRDSPARPQATPSSAESAYSIVRRIAVSGRAETLLACQRGLAGLEQLVVIKRVLPEVAADAQFRAVFIEAARRAITLKHSHLVDLQDLDQRTALYVVMEYLSGEDLSYLIRRLVRDELSMPSGVACRIVAQLAGGLHHAHSACDLDGRPLDLLHLSVAPRNIIVTYTGVAKLLDLGMARADPQDAYTLAGTLKSQLAYRAPEQLRHGEVDARTDVYALGVVLYELLAQQRLFKGDNEADLLKSVMELPVLPPSQLNASVPPVLDTVVLEAIARDPEQRTPSAAELQRQLEQALAETRTFVTHADVAEWMQQTLADRWRERQELERQALQEARDATLTPSTLAQLPSLISGGGSSISTLTPSMATGSGISVSGAAMRVPYEALREGASRALVVTLIISLGILLVVAVAGIAYRLGQRDEGQAEQPAAAMIDPATDDGQPPPQAAEDSPASLLVHVVPGGATVTVDTKVWTDEASVEGILGPVDPGKRLVVEVTKRGYRAKRIEVEAPPEGTRHLYVTLAPERSDEVGKGGAVASAPRARGKRRRARRLRAARSRAGERRSRAAAAPAAEPAAAPAAAEAPPVAELAPAEISSVPAGATVKIDGKLQGRTPLAGLRLAVGRSYEVLIEQPGFEPHRQTLTPQAGATARIAAELGRVAAPAPAKATAPSPPKPPLPAPPAADRGAVHVLSPDTYGEVVVDGKPRGYPPLWVEDLPVDRPIRVQIKVGGRVMRDKTVRLKAGQRLTLRF